MTAPKSPPPATLSEADIARRRDETIKRMIATPPKTHKGKPKRPAQKDGPPQKPGKRGS